MRKIIASLVLFASLFAVNLNAQTAVLVGATAGNGLGNLGFGPSVGLEVPIKRFEVQLTDDYYPVESHTGLGHGWANKAKAGGVVWLGNTVGLTGSAEYSNYSVTKVSKGAYYAFGGLVVRADVNDSPTRLYFNVIKQFKNGVAADGTESSHLIGGQMTWVIRVGCLGGACFRVSEGFTIGHVLEQGNQFCDGSIGPQTCGPRKGAMAGGADFSFHIEFPRHRGQEDKF